MKTLRYILLLFMTISLLSLSAFCIVPEIIEEASVRVEEPVGFRVKAAMGYELSRDEDTTEYGFLVTRKVFLDSLGIPYSKFNASCKSDFIKGVAKGMCDGEYIDRFLEASDTELFFTGHLYGVSPYYYTEIFVLRPYVIYDNAYYYGQAFEVSVYDTAKSMKNSASYDSLSNEHKAFIDLIITYVEGEPYEINPDDFHIVLSTKVVKNANPTYSVSYTLLNPYTGEILRDIKGRKSSKNISEIEAMLLPEGTFVPVFDGIVQDTTDGYAESAVSLSEFSWISAASDFEISLVDIGVSLECKECLSDYVAGEGEKTFTVYPNVPVTVMNGSFADRAFVPSSLDAIISKDKSVLCYYTDGDEVKYADYVRAYAFANQNNHIKFILVYVTDGDTSAKDETCLKHTVFDVTFMVDGKEYFKQSLYYGSLPETPVSPEKDGFIFKGWSDGENEELVNPSLVSVVENMVYHAVFEEIVIKENDPVLLEKLSRGLVQLKRIRLTANSKADIARDLLVECITNVLADAENGNYIDKTYILGTYPAIVSNLKFTIKEKMSAEERSAFVTLLKNENNIDKDVQDFLVEYFDIDLSVI